MTETTDRTWREWRDYLNERGLSRGDTGARVLEAYAAGHNREQISFWLGCSVGYVSTLARIARTR